MHNMTGVKDFGQTSDFMPARQLTVVFCYCMMHINRLRMIASPSPNKNRA